MLKHSRSLLLVLLFIGVAPCAWAQWNTDPPAAQTEQQLATRLAEGEATSRAAAAAQSINRSVLLQLGNGSEARVSQQHTGASEASNASSLTQAGNRNAAVIDQVGAGLTSDVVQSGDDNRVESTMRGEGIESVIRQNGDENVVDQQLSLNNRRYLVEQSGTGNVLEQRESNAAPTRPGYEVRMVGNGIQLTITESTVLPQVEVKGP